MPLLHSLPLISRIGEFLAVLQEEYGHSVTYDDAGGTVQITHSLRGIDLPPCRTARWLSLGNRSTSRPVQDLFDPASFPAGLDVVPDHPLLLRQRNCSS